MALEVVNTVLDTTGFNCYWKPLPNQVTPGRIWTQETVRDKSNGSVKEYLRKGDYLYLDHQPGLLCVRGLFNLMTLSTISTVRGVLRLGYSAQPHVQSIWQKCRNLHIKSLNDLINFFNKDIKHITKELFKSCAFDFAIPLAFFVDSYVFGGVTGIHYFGFGPGTVALAFFTFYNPYAWIDLTEKLDEFRKSFYNINNQPNSSSFLKELASGAITINEIWEVDRLYSVEELKKSTYGVPKDTLSLRDQEPRYEFSSEKKKI